MRPTLQQRMLDVALEADEFAQQYEHLGPEVQGFMHHLWIDRGMVRVDKNDEDFADWKYKSYQDLVLDLNTTGPRRVPIYVPEHIPLMETRQCFYNAYVLATNNQNLTYVEGFAQTSFLVVRHAWVEEADGTIIDPTWGNLDEPEATFFGVRFDDDFVMRHATKTGYTSILDGDWRIDFAALRHGFITDDNGVVIDMEGIA